MTETRSPQPRTRRAQRALATGDVVVLAVVFTVFLAVVVLGCAVLWDVLNRDSWTASGWGAVGTWVAGCATFLAVGVALLESRRGRASADQALWDARRERELDALAAFRMPVRAMSFRLAAIERQVEGFIEYDGFYCRDPEPAISEGAARLLDQLDDFVANFLLPAHSKVESALMVVTDRAVKAHVSATAAEITHIHDTILGWYKELWRQGAPTLPEPRLSAGPQKMLDELLPAVETAYPADSPGRRGYDQHAGGAQ